MKPPVSASQSLDIQKHNTWKLLSKTQGKNEEFYRIVYQFEVCFLVGKLLN